MENLIRTLARQMFFDNGNLDGSSNEGINNPQVFSKPSISKQHQAIADKLRARASLAGPARD